MKHLHDPRQPRNWHEIAYALLCLGMWLAILVALLWGDPAFIR